MPRVCLGPGVLLAVLSASLFGSGFTQAQANPPEPSRLELDDPVLPLEPKVARTATEADRVRAVSLFAAGRMLEQNGDASRALRKYQRAYQYDPDDSLLMQIIPLAFGLDRGREAVRYALIAAEKSLNDTVLLHRLAIYLTEQGDFKRALPLYEAVVKQSTEDEELAAGMLTHLELGRLYFLNKQYEQAADAFTVVQTALEQRDPAKGKLPKPLRSDPYLTYLLFAESYLAAGRFDQAAEAFRRSQDAKPQPGVLDYHLARVEAKRNNIPAALANLKNYFDTKSSVQGVEPYELLAELLTASKDQASLVPRLEALHQTDPDNSSLTIFLAKQHLESGKARDAEQLYLQLINKPDDNVLSGYGGLIRLRAQEDDAAKLLAALAIAVEKSDTLELFKNQLQPLLETPARLQALIQLAQQRHEAGQSQAGETLAVAQLAMLSKQFDVARQFYEFALKDNPERTGELLLTWGMDLFLADQFTASAEVFQRCIDGKHLPDEEPALYFYLAAALEMSGQTDQAISAAQRAAKLRPDSVQFCSRAAWIQFHAKRYPEAIASYQKLLKKFDDQHESADVRDALREARLMLSSLFVLQGDYALGEEYLEQVLDEFPEDIGTLNDLGYLWVDQNKRLDRALEMIERAVKSEPNSQAYLDSLGWAYYRLGRFQDAVDTLEKSVAIDEPDGVILDHLADAYFKLGRIEKATEAWQRAVGAFEKSNEPERAEKVREKLDVNHPSPAP